MDLKDALLRRRSVRKYTDEAVSDEMISELMHAAMSGPSACNKVPWEFYAVTAPEALEKLRKASRFTNMKAPLAIIVCGNLSRALPMQMAEYWVQDCSAATENILLRAVDLGLGSCWCGIYPQQRAVENVREMLGLPEEQVPLNIIYIGHPAEAPEARDQYREEFVHYIR